MAKATQHMAEGFHAVTPYLVVDGAAAAIEFYKEAFGASETLRLATPGGSICHAEIRIGDSMVMLADECAEADCLGPESVGGTPVSLMIYVSDADRVFNQAIAAGATSKRPVKDQFYGDRSGTIEDPFGHVWTIATHVEDVPPEEMDRRAKAFLEQTAEPAL